MYDVLEEFMSPYLKQVWPQPDDPSQFKKTRALDQMSDLGYNTYNPIINLGTLWLLMMLYFVKVFFTLFFMFPLSMRFQRVKAAFQKQMKAIFFGEFLVIFIEGYLEFLIVSFLVYQAPDDSPDKSLFLLSFGYACFSIANVLVPLIILWHLKFKSLE